MATLTVATLNIRNLADRWDVWDRPAVGDPTLYASDHFGLVADLAVGEGG